MHHKSKEARIYVGRTFFGEMQASPDMVSVLDLNVLVLFCGSFMFWCSAAAAAPCNGVGGAAQRSSHAH